MRVCTLNVVIALSLLGCNAESPPPGSSRADELETEDVVGGIDVELSTELDEKGPPLSNLGGGVLPSSFPVDLPVYRPATIIDFGVISDGEYVEFQSPSNLESVAADLERRIAKAGWQTVRTAEGISATLGERRVEIGLSDVRPGTRIRVEY